MESTLITTVDLKKLTAISQNMDVALLEPHLLIAQQLYLEPVLGTALYTDIINKFDSVTGLTGASLTLYNDYIVPALAYASWFCAAPFLHFKTQRQGVGVQTSDSQTPVTVEELSLYVARIENLMNYYLNRITNYLVEDNYVNFPLFRSDDTPKLTNKGSSLFLNFK
jgi:hypothetical protein